MKITVTKQVEQEVEITFPYYSKNDYAFYALLNEEQAVKVSIGRSIDTFYTTSVFEYATRADAIEVTAKEFEVAFDNEFQRMAEIIVTGN